MGPRRLAHATHGLVEKPPRTTLYGWMDKCRHLLPNLEHTLDMKGRLIEHQKMFQKAPKLPQGSIE